MNELISLVAISDAIWEDWKEAENRILSVGRKLLKAKELCPHGTFGDWVDANCPFKYKQANKYMKIAKEEHLLLAAPTGVNAAVEDVRETTQMSPAGRHLNQDQAPLKAPEPKSQSWPTIQKREADGQILSPYEIQTKVLKIIGKAKIAEEVDMDLGSLEQYDQKQLDGIHAAAREAMNRWSRIVERVRSKSATNLRIVEN